MRSLNLAPIIIPQLVPYTFSQFIIFMILYNLSEEEIVKYYL
nr:MAG TPA: hypothetical protein [Caudoviricetes sp.]